MRAGFEITFTVPIRTVSPLNVREHWRVRNARVQRERLATAVVLNPRHTKRITLPVVVRMTRTAPARNRIKDSDALPGALKAIRDQVARTLGVDDRDLVGQPTGVIWAPPTQEAGPWGVRVVITSIPSTTPVAAGEPGTDPRVIGLGITWEHLSNLVRAARKVERWTLAGGPLPPDPRPELTSALAPFADAMPEIPAE